MAKKQKSKTSSKKRPIEQYEHKDKQRVNNPPVGLVNPDTDPDVKAAALPKKKYAYDPHLDPQLVWAGKAERTSFEVPTVSLHVHERIDPRTIIEAVRKKNGSNYEQMSLFGTKEENPPLRDAIEFYKHRHNWSNRLIAGDSLLVMNSLIEKEGLAGQVQMIYIDPPYGIKYGSNFQPFVNKRDVKDGKDEDLTAEPEMIKAFRDTWELGIHSYITYLRDRLLFAKELLTENGSVFVQISDDNVHHLKELMDEVFLTQNFVALIFFRKKTMPLGGKFLERMGDYIIWYAKDKQLAAKKYHQLYRDESVEGDFHWKWFEMQDRTRHQMSDEQLNDHSLLPRGARVFRLVSMWPPTYDRNFVFEVDFRGKKWFPPEGACYPTGPDGIKSLVAAHRLEAEGQYLRYVMYLDESYPKLTATWNDTIGARDQRYVVETSVEVVKRCILMCTDPGDLIFDPTCGGGTTAYAAEAWGRRWITCDTSRVALSLAKQRLMTSVFDYFALAHEDEGIGSGLRYNEVLRTSLATVTAAESPERVIFYDRPLNDNSRTRVSGPFTVEAVPAPTVKVLNDVGEVSEGKEADVTIARSGETLRHAEWRSELLKSGIRGKNGQYILFSRVEPLAGTRWLHAEAETKPNDRGSDSVKETMAAYGKPQRVVICFGPEHAPLEQRQVELAWQEARDLVPRPSILVFAAFQFDPEASKDIDELDPKKVSMILLKAQMNADLLTDDLKKKRTSSDSFWLVGQPDAKITKIKSGDAEGKFQVEVLGFDYYNTKTGTIESGGTERIAMWMLDTDYDGRSLFPRQVFFPMAGENEGWAKLARNLKAEIDEELIESYRGTVSLPFEPGKNKRIAVKIVDDRGIESLLVRHLSGGKVMDLGLSAKMIGKE